MEFSLAESLAVAAQVARILEQLEIPYAVGGSVASSLHGVPRSTMDVDVAAAIAPRHIDPLCESLGEEFYWSKESIQEAVRRRDSFNIIELGTMLKMDIFVVGPSGGVERAIEVETHGGHRFRVVTAEDIVIEKLRWYRLGGEVSQRQWRDVLGVIEVQGERLDRELLGSLAEAAGLTDLLKKALAEATEDT